MSGGGLLSRLLERIRRRRAQRPPNFWRDLGKFFREEDRKAGRIRNRETDEKLRCGWSYLHRPGAEEDESTSDRRTR